MIRLPYGYGIVADSNGYAVGKIAVKTVKDRQGNASKCEYLQSPSFPSTLRGCVEFIQRKEHQRIIAEKDLTLSQAVIEIDKTNKHLEAILKDVIREAVNKDEFNALMAHELNIERLVDAAVEKALSGRTKESVTR